MENHCPWISPACEPEVVGHAVRGFPANTNKDYWLHRCVYKWGGRAQPSTWQTAGKGHGTVSVERAWFKHWQNEIWRIVSCYLILTGFQWNEPLYTLPEIKRQKQKNIWFPYKCHWTLANCLGQQGCSAIGTCLLRGTRCVLLIIVPRDKGKAVSQPSNSIQPW